jgi:hypothetical protein
MDQDDMSRASVRVGGAWVESPSLKGAARVAGAWVAFGDAAGPVVGESFFGNEAPAIPNAVDANPLALATRFVCKVPGKIYRHKWVCPTTLPTGTVTAGIMKNSNQGILGTVDFTVLIPGAVCYADYAAPIDLVVDEQYSAVIWTPTTYVATGNYAWPVSSSGGGNSGGLLTDAATAGRFSNGSYPTFPTSSFQNGNYFSDVVFVRS